MLERGNLIFRLFLAAGIAFTVTQAHAGTAIPDECKIGGFVLGCQAWSFNRFTAFEAIEKTAQAGGKTIEFYPGQKLSSDHGDVKLDQGLSDELIEKLKAKLAKHGITAVNYGVVGLSNDEEQSRKVFNFAKKMGITIVTSEPSADAFDLLEKLVKEYDISLAIHNHPRRKNRPGYKYWDPNYVLSIVNDRDQRMGACADTGHWLRSDVKPLKALKILKGRIISVHLKDLSAPSGHDVPYGTGVAKVRDILDELTRQKFNGNISIEYEYNWNKSVPEIAQCIGFVRGYGN